MAFGVRFCLGFTLLVLLTSSAARAATSREDYAKPSELTQLLHDGEFDRLAAAIEHYQHGFETGVLPEALVEATFMAFANSEPRLEKSLNAWASSNSADYQAYTARGVYFWNLGILSRGPARHTGLAPSFDNEARQYFEHAQADLEAASRLRPALTFAFSLLIHIAVQRDRKETIEDLLHTSLDAGHDSLLIKRRYLDSVGSQGLSRTSQQGTEQPSEREKIANFLRRQAHDPASRASAIVLAGYADMARGDELVRSNQRLAAAEFYNRAVSSADYWLYELRRATNNYRLGQWSAALTDLDAVLAERPYAARILSLRARTLLALNRVDAAFADWTQALILNPFDPLILLHHAFASRDEQRLEEALNSLGRALELGSENQHVWDARGRIYLYDKKFFSRAAHDFARAIEIDPASHRHRFNYAAALYNDRSCLAADALGYYLGLCQVEDCPADNVAWVQSWSQDFDEAHRCERLESDRNIDRQKRGSSEK